MENMVRSCAEEVEGKDLVGSLSQMSCSTSLTVRHLTVSINVTMQQCNKGKQPQ
jgi:hypothetical protein